MYIFINNLIVPISHQLYFIVIPRLANAPQKFQAKFGSAKIRRAQVRGIVIATSHDCKMGMVYVGFHSKFELDLAKKKKN